MRIEQKWGFGMSPVKPEVQTERQIAVDAVIEVVETGVPLVGVEDQISAVKGLFNRTWRQDQWDWFTVWAQLGYPGRNSARQGGELLAQLRSSVLDRQDLDRVSYDLDRCGITSRLERFGEKRQVPEDQGFIYILSTREQRDLLKIGYTERDIEVRVREINKSTGVLVPYGVRALWMVHNAPHLESEIHRILAPYRVRGDREFFHMDFFDAFPRIRDLVYASRAESYSFPSTASRFGDFR